MARQVHAQQLDRLVTIRQRLATRDERGQAAESWIDRHTSVWAARLPVRGRDYFAAGTQQHPVDVRYLVRHRSDMQPGMVVVDAGEPHEILAVIDVDGKRRTLELMCVTGTRPAGAA